MNSFVDAVETEVKKPRKTRTENGARAYTQTGDSVLNYFSKVGANRGNDNLSLFISALTENEDLAIRALLWTRDIRQGAGERDTFRKLCNHLAINNYKLAERIADKIPELGRWDDLLVFVNTPVEQKAFSLIQKGLEEGNGLCAKWMPRKGSVAEKLRNYLGFTPKRYRKTLVNLTKVVETQMCNKEWSEIEFGKVPSVASQLYRNAFKRNAPKEYQDYLNKLTKGEAKVNAGAVYPHTVVQVLKSGDKQLANAQWDSLPNFVPEGSSVLPMIDTSGSMFCSAGGSRTVQCVDVAVGLGMYVASKNTGAFKDLWLNFSTMPKLYKLKGKTLVEKYNSIDWRDWSGSTNLEAAFKLILKTAVDNEVSQEDMPKTLIIFSDMQFDYATHYPDKTLFKNMKLLYKEAGYKVPKVVFWNLREAGNSPAKVDSNGVALVSGFSPSLMKSVLSDDIEKFTPFNVMLDVLISERYNY